MHAGFLFSSLTFSLLCSQFVCMPSFHSIVFIAAILCQVLTVRVHVPRELGSRPFLSDRSVSLVQSRLKDDSTTSSSEEKMTAENPITSDTRLPSRGLAVCSVPGEDLSKAHCTHAVFDRCSAVLPFAIRL